MTTPSPKDQLVEEKLKAFALTKFAKGGGSSFECSDYEGMYNDLQVFLRAALSEAYEAGQADPFYGESIATIEARRDLKKETIAAFTADLRTKIEAMKYSPNDRRLFPISATRNDTLAEVLSLLTTPEHN